MSADDFCFAVSFGNIIGHIVSEQCAVYGLTVGKVLALNDFHDLSGSVVQLLRVHDYWKCFYHNLHKHIVRHLVFSLGKRHHTAV